MITGRRALLGLPLGLLVTGCGQGAGDRPLTAQVTDLGASGAPAAADPPSGSPSADPASADPAPSDPGPSDPGLSDPGSPAGSPTPSGPGAWADGHPGGTVTLLRGYAPARAVALLEGRVPRFRTVSAALDWVGAVHDGTRGWGCAAVVDGWTLVWEEMGAKAALPEFVAPLSRRGVCATASWNDEVGTSFALARAGRVVRLIGPDHPYGDLGRPLAQEAGLGLGAGFPSPSTMLVLLSRVTGTTVAEQAWFERRGQLVFGFFL